MAAATGPAPRTQAGSGPASAPEARLLIVDDEPSIVELLAASLRYAGFEVMTAAGGREALTVTREQQPDLLVLDVMMPDVDGFGVIRRLRADGRQIPVVFLTARDATEDKVTGLTLGGDDRVFERFYRADASRTRGHGGGSGLGLSIVAALVAAHGGTVEVDTAPGEGATFRVLLPTAGTSSVGHSMPCSASPITHSVGGHNPTNSARRSAFSRSF